MHYREDFYYFKSNELWSLYETETLLINIILPKIINNLINDNHLNSIVILFLSLLFIYLMLFLFQSDLNLYFSIRPKLGNFIFHWHCQIKIGINGQQIFVFRTMWNSYAWNFTEKGNAFIPPLVTLFLMNPHTHSQF